jgi:hypothetical protein
VSPDDFTPENGLEEALIAAAADPSRRPRFFETLFESEVFVPMQGPPPADDRLMSAPSGSEIDLPVVEDGGRSIVPAFTSMTQLLRFVPEGTGYMQVAVRDLVKLWQDDLWLALNPRGPGVMLSPSDVQRLPAPMTAPPDLQGPYLLGIPKEEPEELLAAVRAYAERSGGVVAAYRALIKSQEQGAEPRVVIGLELVDPSDRDMVFSQLTHAGRESGVEAFVLALVDRARPSDVASFLLESTKPFYRRGA